MTCGCAVTVDDVDLGFSPPKIAYNIDYCKLHASAGEMLSILHGISESECDYCVGEEGEDNYWIHESDCELMQVITRAESKEGK